MRKIDNRGISLVEIMVVVSIMAVVGGVGIWGLNMLTGRPAQQSAQKVMYSLERHRTTAMGKVDSYYILRVQSSGKIVCEEGIKNSNDPSVPYSTTVVDVGASRVKISYEPPTGGGLVDLAPGQELKFVFDRGSGAFATYPCKRLVFKSGRREFNLKLVQLTGKVYLD